MQSKCLSFNFEPQNKYTQISDKVDIKSKNLKISQDSPYFNTSIKKIQNFQDIKICKESIYKFLSNLNIENEKENPLSSVLLCFMSYFNKYLKTSEIKSQQTIGNDNSQSELFDQPDQEEQKKEIYETLNSDLPEQEETIENLETKSETDKKDIIQKINEFLMVPEFSSEKEAKIPNNDELKNFLEIHSNNECFKETITPILKDNHWQINFPSWADKVESFSPEQIIASTLEIIIILSYQTYKVANIKVISLEGEKDLNDVIKEINNKYISLNNYSAFPLLFEVIIKKSFFPPKKLLCNKFEEYLQSHNIKKDETIDTSKKCEAFIEDILNEFKTEDMIQFREKMKQFFEKLTFYNIDDIKKNKYKHIVYYYLRDFIMKFVPFTGLTDNINNIVNKLDKMNEKYNQYKKDILEKTKYLIYDGLKTYFTVKFVDYGSHFTNLYLPESDLDFRLFFKEIDKKKPVNQNEFEQILSEIFENMKEEIKTLIDYQCNLNVEPILNTNPPLFKLTYNIYNKYNGESIIVKIDVTFEKDIIDEKGINYSEKILKKRNKHINDEIAKNPSIRKNKLVLKLLLKNFDMNSNFTGGISSYISNLLYDNSVKMYKNYFDNNNFGLQLVLFFFKFSNYQYNYYIDKNGIDQFLTDKDKDYFVIKNPTHGNNENEDDSRFYVDDPVSIEHENVAYPCYNTDLVKKFFWWLLLKIINGNNITQILQQKYEWILFCNSKNNKQQQ